MIAVVATSSQQPTIKVVTATSVAAISGGATEPVKKPRKRDLAAMEDSDQDSIDQDEETDESMDEEDISDSDDDTQIAVAKPDAAANPDVITGASSAPTCSASIGCFVVAVQLQLVNIRQKNILFCYSGVEENDEEDQVSSSVVAVEEDDSAALEEDSTADSVGFMPGATEAESSLDNDEDAEAVDTENASGSGSQEFASSESTAPKTQVFRLGSGGFGRLMGQLGGGSSLSEVPAGGVEESAGPDQPSLQDSLGSFVEEDTESPTTEPPVSEASAEPLAPTTGSEEEQTGDIPQVRSIVKVERGTKIQTFVVARVC